MMTRMPRASLYCALLRSYVRNSSSRLGNFEKIKVISEDGGDSLKISFRYGSMPLSRHPLTFKAPIEQPIQELISRIKLVVALQRKREEMRRSVANKYAGTAQVEEVYAEEDDDVDVSLIHNDKILERNMKNSEAWVDGSLLKVGDTVFEIARDTPSVLSLTLPDYILACCIIRPHFVLECAVLKDCQFFWYRSVSKDNDEGIERGNGVNDDEKLWEKVCEGFTYLTLVDDVGCRLKVVCIPKFGNRCGEPFTSESRGIVERGPEVFPFEDRQLCTKDLANKDSIRCMSYNILANIYVETRKFPYCSKKAKDSYYRKQLLLREILGYNSDIICLQEVQERVFDHDLMPVFKTQGFEGYFKRKGGRRYEGLACFFRTSKFRLVESRAVYLNDIVKKKDIFVPLLGKISGNFKNMSKMLAQDTVLQVLLLENIDEPKRRILVANTHLYSNKDSPEVRLFQAALCICYTEYMLKKNDNDSPALLFCGDFNSMPTSEAFKFITSGSYECCSSWKNNETVSDTTLRHSLLLDSACGTPAYTNYTEEFNGCLDYIFYSKNSLSVSEVVPMPSHETVIKDVALPSELFPSDHIALVCTLKWKQE